jgi:hypothetical protein
MADLADNFTDELHDLLQDELMQFGNEVQADLVRTISEPYPPASRPYEPPHHCGIGMLSEDYGPYSSSIGVEVINTADETSVTIFTDDPRGAWFEDGTPNMAPRPHFGAMFEKWEPEFDRRMSQFFT